MINANTRLTLKARLTGSQCQLARELNVPVGTVSDILRGRHDHVSLASENRVREALGLAPLRPPPVLYANERLIRSEPPEKRDKRRCLHVSPELFARLREQRGCLSQEEFVSILADMWDAKWPRVAIREITDDELLALLPLQEVES